MTCACAAGLGLGGGFPEVAQQEVVEAAFALVAAKESEAQEEVFHGSTMRPGGVFGAAARAVRKAVHGCLTPDDFGVRQVGNRSFAQALEMMKTA